MFIEQRIEIEDAQHERAFLESIGSIGRMLDNNAQYILVLGLLCAASASVGVIFGFIMWVF
jgi:hypothetical protein